MNWNNEFDKVIKEIAAAGHSQTRVFEDFLNMFCLTIANPLYKSPILEKQYLDTVRHYKNNEIHLMCRLMAVVTKALEEGPKDFLGDAYIRNDNANRYRGQFFTPTGIGKLIANAILVPKDGYGTKVYEPCVGSGSMIIKMHQENPRMTYVCGDIDYNCFCMAYIQLSLLWVRATVIWGDSLKFETRLVLKTPRLLCGM